MSSWASIAKASPQPVVAAQDLTSSTDNLRLLVVDANAIIGGIKLEGIADRAVTIQEVFDEIRDKQSRQFLSTLPYKLQLSEPTEESIKAGERVFEK
jgi:RNA-binding protein NOB1